jgi:hypothetical protein
MREYVCKKKNEKDLQTGGLGLMEGQIRNIRFSQCDSRQVTEVLDRTLDTRDRYLFMTRFRGCRIGYLKGEEYKRMNRGGNTSLWSRLKDTLRSGYFWIPMLFSVMFGIGCIAFYYKKIGEPLFSLWPCFDIWIILICICIFPGLFGAVEVPAYWGKKKDMVLWENRKDHRYHLLTTPVFYRFCKESLISSKVIFNSQTKLLSDLYLEAARDLSWLRCLCLISEKIKPMVESYGEENIEMEILADDGCNEEDRNGNYTIVLKGCNRGDANTVIPMDAQTEERSFELPFVIGEKIVNKYHSFGILDFSILDRQGEKVMKSEILRDTGTSGNEGTEE